MLRGLTLFLGASCLVLPLSATTIELSREPQCTVPLRFEITKDKNSSMIEIAAGASSFDSPAGVLALAEPRSCWSAPLIVGNEPLKLQVRKARQVRGSIAPSVEDVPQALRIAFRPPGAAEGTLVTDVVPVEKNRSFTSRLPADRLDLRIEASGFAPAYLWRFDSDVIQPLKLIPGASVSGWVTAPSKTDLRNVTVRLIPATATWRSPDAPEQKLQTRTAKANADGFFQIAGIEAGTWSVLAEGPLLSPAKPLEIELRDGTEEALRRPLDLRKRGSLSVSITPLASFDGSPWKVDLYRYVPLSTYTKPVVTEPASLAGQWEKENLEAGTYLVRILGARGESMKDEEVELADGAAHVDVRIDAVAIHGKVTLGGKPVPVAMKWITMRGERIAVQTDDEGAFKTVLPKAGTWYVDAKSGKTEYLTQKRIEVEAPDDGGTSVVDIRIPTGTVRGKVVDRNGRAVTDVAAWLVSPTVLRALRVAEDGTFEFVGLAEGLHTVYAESATLKSNTAPVQVSESSVAEVTLVADATRRIAGWLTTPSGNPVAGAQIMYWTAGLFPVPAESSPSGQFTITLPATATSVHLSVVAPSRPAKLVTMPLPPQGERLQVTVSSDRSTLRLNLGSRPPWPYVFSRDGAAVSLVGLLRQPVPGMWPEYLDYDTGAISLAIEPGAYEFCDSLQRNRCVSAQANAGSTSMVDLTGLWSAK